MSEFVSSVEEADDNIDVSGGAILMVGGLARPATPLI